MQRYSVQCEKLDKKHPLWKNEVVYYIYDELLRKRTNPFTVYTNKIAATNRMRNK